ncbi:hypothetical protein F5Y05DRAFT_414050 [Hypoxylon sp. FL0543]|nr:hypothetical protein F5Y05DRAFT_414050 [Hypoxylon sp. FL0543]
MWNANNHQWGVRQLFPRGRAIKFENDGDIVGHANIRAQISGLGIRFQAIQHSLTNIDPGINGDKATEEGWKIATVQLRKLWAQTPNTEGFFEGEPLNDSGDGDK